MGLGKTYSTKYLLDSNNSSGIAGQVLSTTSTGIDWVNANTVPGAGLWIEGISSNNIYNSNSGNVGIGTTVPAKKLHVKDTTGTFEVIIAQTSGGGSFIRNIDSLATVETGVQAGKWSARTSSVQRLVIDSTGKVGIGTTSPSHLLSINGAVNTKQLTFYVGTTGQYAAIGAQRSNTNLFCSSEIRFINENNNAGAGAMSFGTGLNSINEAMRIDSDGNVGIGTTGPNYKLSVGTDFSADSQLIPYAGNIVIAGPTQSSFVTGLDNNNYGRMSWMASSRYLSFTTKEDSGVFTDTLVIRSGKVGIGTTSPDNISSTGTVLSISTQGALTTNSLAGSLTFLTNDASFTNTYADGVTTEISSISESTTGAAYGLSFSTSTITSSNRAERMRITATGNVGIGTISPGAKLDVNGATFVRNVIFGYAGGGNQYGGLNWGGTDEGFLFLKDSNVTKVIINSNGDSYLNGGNVGIGVTSPEDYGASANTLEVRGASGTGAGLVRVSNAGNTVGAAFYSGSASSSLGTQTNHELILITNNTSRVVIGNTGAVRFNAYAAGTLVTDNSGNISVSSGGGAGGPFLPLTAGPSFPLTGNLIINSTSSGIPVLLLNAAGNANCDITMQSTNTSSVTRLRTGVNDFQIHTNGSQRVTVTSAGNVGIGTTTPDVGGAGSSSTVLSVIETVGNRRGILELGDNQNADTGGIGSINFVGTYQDAGHKVMAEIRASGSGATSGQRGSFISMFTKENGTAAITEKMRIESGGDVGIGVTNPGSYWANANNLVVGNLGTVSGITIATDGNFTGSLIFADNVGLSGASGGLQYNHVNNNMTFRVNDSSPMTIRSDGNVGIGTADPQTALHVTGATRIDGLLFNRDVNAGYYSSTADLTLRSGTSGRTFINPSGGNVGIGTTTPVKKLNVEVAGGDGIRVTNSTNPGYFCDLLLNFNDVSTLQLTCLGTPILQAGNTGNTVLASRTNKDIILSPNGTGNVGIGTTLPGTKLDVNGSIRTNGSIQLTNAGVNTIEATNVNNGFLRFLVDQQGVALTLNADTTATFGGRIYAVDGNKALPSYSFTNDPDTGMFSDTANQLEFATGASTRMIITSTGALAFGGENNYGTSGQVLTSNGNAAPSWQSGGGGGASSLNGLSDCLVDTASLYVGTVPSGLSSNPQNNTILGIDAGTAITTGFKNTFLGTSAGKSITGGDQNTFIGYEAGKLVTGNKSTYIGEGAGGGRANTNDNNTAVGYNAGKYMQNADNVAIGKDAARFADGSSNRNVVIGSNAMSGAFGNKFSSVAIGYRALNGATAISDCVAVGDNSMASASATYHCTFVGHHSGLAITTGFQNTSLGKDSGKNVTTGSNTTSIGYNAQATSATATNEITLGNSSVSTLRCAVTSITSLSDERDKSGIKDLEYGLDFINSLKPREFVWDNRVETTTEIDDEGNETEVEFYSANKGKKDFGFIAQEVQTVDNDTLRLVYDNNPDKIEMSYGKLVPVLVKAIQELKAEIELLKQK